MVSESGGSREALKTIYTTCQCNCGGNQHCVLKAHVRDGKIIAVEPDDRYNKNVGREDAVLTEGDLLKNRLQRRPCTMGLAFHRYIYHPERLLYPLRRSPGSRRGDGKWERISWDEAFDTIAQKLESAREKYGPRSIIVPYMHMGPAEYLLSQWGAGVGGWGASSCDAAWLMAHVVAGYSTSGADYSASSAADMLANAKVIVLWGFDPTVTHHGPAHQFAWFIKLAREKGTPVIIIEPRYSSAVGTLADQWIPIKPGTDHAMFMAMAHVLFEEDRWDREFVKKFVEPAGFQKWQDYILGRADGIPRTPEWAETRCAVPAKTIRELARLVGTVRPSWLWANWSLSRKSDGEQMVSTFAALQTMLGSWGTPGAGPIMRIGPTRNIPVGMGGSWISTGKRKPLYRIPKLYRGHNWAEAVVLLDSVRRGELSEKDYMRMVGWRADASLLKDFNPKVMFALGGRHPHTSDYVSTACNSSNLQVEAMQRMDFIVTSHSVMNSSTKYADIILPVRDDMWEEKFVLKSEYGGFESINYCPGAAKAPGETKPLVWIYVKIAERLGLDPHEFFPYYTSDENWEQDWERYQHDIYQSVIDHYKSRGKEVPPWEEFTQGSFINCEELDDGPPFVGFEEEIRNRKPFQTQSGKIEFYSTYVSDEANRGKSPHIDTTGRLYDNLPADWGDMTHRPPTGPSRGVWTPRLLPTTLFTCLHHAHGTGSITSSGNIPGCETIFTVTVSG